jgi:major intracellular serine protease
LKIIPFVSLYKISFREVLFMKVIHVNPTSIVSIHQDVNEIPKGVSMIKAPLFWEQSNKGEGSVIAILDSGCDILHPDLNENILGVGNFTGDDHGDHSNVTDYLGHGTHVAGTVAATENGKGVVGVAPNSKLLIIKVIGKDGVGNMESLLKGLEYAIHWRGKKGEKVDVINMSLGGIRNEVRLYNLIQKAYSKNIYIVAAAGNFGDGLGETHEILYPGYYVETIQVGAIGMDYKVLNISNSNDRLDFVGPGENILSTYLNGSYAMLTGTSMATPHVSGAIALLKNYYKNEEHDILNPINLHLLNKALPLGYATNLEGKGLIQL